MGAPRRSKATSPARRQWMPYHELVRESLARLVGAKPVEVVAMNTLTVNLHLMMVSFYRPTRERPAILIEAGAFPSDRYAVESQIALPRLRPGHRPDRTGSRRARRHHLDGGDRTRHRRARPAPRAGAVAGRAVPHRAGLRPARRSRGWRMRRARSSASTWRTASATSQLALHDSGADFAVWCHYKYLNSGPGAVAGCFVHERHAQHRPSALRRLVGPRPATRASAWARSSCRRRAPTAGSSAIRRSWPWRRCARRWSCSTAPAWPRCARSRAQLTGYLEALIRAAPGRHAADRHARRTRNAAAASCRCA